MQAGFVCAYHGAVHRTRRKLAASFVVTVAVLPSCKKTSGPDDGTRPVGIESAGVWARPDGRCFLSVPQHCPRGVACNPPPPEEVDCTPEHRDAAAPPPVARRPKGKEDWVRVKPHFWASRGACSYVPERFCAPPGKPFECTPYPDAVKVPCANEEPDASPMVATKNHVEAFVYKDGVGTCHAVAAFECAGGCELPEGEPTACP